MKTTKDILVVLSIVFLPLVATVPLSAAPAVEETASTDAGSEPAETAADTRVLVGEYQWRHQNQPGPLRAEFTATGEEQWDVAFHFTFDGRDRIYLGTAEGSFLVGEFEGIVRSDDERRTFTFEAEIEDGKFEGTHAETTPGRAGRTGTMTLAVFGSGD